MALSNPIISKLLIVTGLIASSYTVSGNGIANGTVNLTFKDPNNKTISTTVKVNSNGKFSTKLDLRSLIDGKLNLEAYQKDRKGNVSPITKQSVLKDTIGPSIFFNVSDITLDNQSAYLINGSVEANQKVTLSVSDGAHSALSKEIVSTSDGSFSSTFNLSAFNDGNITINSVSSDSYGNKTNSSISVKKNTVPVVTNPDESKVYELNATERLRWGIYNDNSHPVQTTNGFNSALKWAHENGYTIFHLPAGTYLIAKGVEDRDNIAQINMVSDMTFLMDKDTIIQKETNQWEQYAVISLGKDARNVTIKGGTLKGDRATHDYSYVGPYTSGTHEWGNGIITEGAMNVSIDGVTLKDFTGDGIQAGGTTLRSEWIGSSDVELGSLDDSGNAINQNGKIRTNLNRFEKYTFTDPVYQDSHYRNIMMWTPDGVTGHYDLFYYRQDGSLLRIDKNQDFNSSFGYSKIPDGAAYWRAVFNASDTSGIGVQMMSVAVTENLTIQNSDIGFNRRQGISLVGTDGVKILNNKIHDISGTSPGSGIDLEPGFYPGINTEISGNEFLNNKIHVVLAYGGHVVANNNSFGPGATFTSTSWGGVSASNNTFNHATFVGTDNVNFKNNKLISGGAVFEGGENVYVDGIEGIDSDVSINQTVENGIQASNISLISSGQDSEQHGFAIWGDQSLHLSNVYLEGNNGIGGYGLASNIYENVTFNNTRQSNLAAGTYNNSIMNNATFAFYPGKIVLNQGKFKNTTFYVENEYSDVTIQNSVFNFDKSVPGNVFLAMEAKKVSLLNNTINDTVTTNPDHPLIQIGRDAWKGQPTRVYGAIIKGNTLTSRVKRVGIDTTNGGTGAPAYDVENNTLNNSTLSLTSKDINKNNIIK